jgi:probable phosphoglycerate mutase
MEYLFIRHGESVVNLSRTISNGVRDDSPLTALGRNQAEALGDSLQNWHVTSVYSSPLARARETADIIVSKLGLQVAVVDALREPYCGMIEGRSDEQAWKIHAAAWQAWRAGNYDHRISGGESFNDIRDRFIPFIEQMIEKHQGQPGSIIVVSHGSLLMNMLPIILSNLDTHFADAHPLSNCSMVRAIATHAGLTCLEWHGIQIGS